jgi:N-acetylglucosaminyl-diphospho-decaprenol L-rhamnosyltransferase
MPEEKSVSLLIGIVTYNHCRLIGPCLDSITRSNIDDRIRIKVVVVDNCSSDGSAELVRNLYPWVDFIQQDKRRSFAENNNVAFGSYSGKYFLMLNPDTVLDKMSLAVLVNFMDNHPSCGICGPKLVFPDGSLQYSCRRFPTAWSAILRRTPIRLVVPNVRRGARHLMVSLSHEREMEVDWMLGACLLLRRDAITGTKVLDEEFPLYCEDIDLCRRLGRAGWKIYYVPSTTVVHHHMARSDSRLLCRESLLHTLSMLHFVKKHYLFAYRDADLHPGVKRIQPKVA